MPRLVLLLLSLLPLCSIAIAHDHEDTASHDATEYDLLSQQKSPPLWSFSISPPATSRVVAVPDVHGDFDTLVKLLKQLQIIDGKLNWTGGSTYLVQLGDVVDRGPKSKQAMDLLMKLQDEAPSQGGQVFVLWGNHEVMQLFGNFQFAGSDELAMWQEKQPEENEYEAQLEDVQSFLNNPPSRYYSTLQETEFYPGHFSHRLLWGHDGKYAKWLLNFKKHPVVLRVGRTLFVHAGLHRKFENMSLRQINIQFRHELVQLMNLFKQCVEVGYCHYSLGIDSMLGMLQHEGPRFSHLPGKLQNILTQVQNITTTSLVEDHDGPVWYRGFVQKKGKGIKDSFLHVLKQFDCDYMIVGHTVPQSKTPQTHFDKKLVQLDSGMNQFVFRGRAAAAIWEPKGTDSPQWQLFVAKLRDEDL